MPLSVGLNPYGLTYTLGLQGAGPPRANPHPRGLEGFLAIAAEAGARVVELDWRWLTPMSDAALAALGARLAAARQRPIVSAWPTHTPGETLDAPVRAAVGVGAALLRLHLTPVLEGARARQGDRWLAMLDHARRTVLAAAPRARDAGLALGFENHQDLGSEELLELAEACGPHAGIVFDTGNPFAVGEDPVAFARRVAGRVRHLHLKDYRAQCTDEGVRLVRCAIGDGAVPFAEIMAVVMAGGADLTASLEPAALEARHIRCFTEDWWRGYRPRAVTEFATALGRLRHRAYREDEDARTPWERGDPPEAIVAYEQDQLQRSLAFVGREIRTWGHIWN